MDDSVAGDCKACVATRRKDLRTLKGTASASPFLSQALRVLRDPPPGTCKPFGIMEHAKVPYAVPAWALSQDPTTAVAFRLRQKVVIPFTIGLSPEIGGLPGFPYDTDMALLASLAVDGVKLVRV